MTATTLHFERHHLNLSVITASELTWCFRYNVIRILCQHDDVNKSFTRRVPLAEQELCTLPEHLSLPPGFSGFLGVQTLVFCVVLCWIIVCPFFFFFTIVLSVLSFSVQNCVDHCLSFFLLAIVLSILQFSMQNCVDHCLSFFLLASVLSILKVYMQYCVYHCLSFLSCDHCVVCPIGFYVVLCRSLFVLFVL